jgi:hypothetical protein
MKTLYIWLLVSWKVLTGRISVKKLEALLGSDVSTQEVTVVTSNKPKPIERWIKKDGVIYFAKPFVANGWTAQQWKNWFGNNRSDLASQLLDSPHFQPTPEGTIVNPVILLGDLFPDNERTTRNIRAKEAELKFVNPNPDLVLLVIKNFSVEEIRAMGLLWLIGMHEPIKDSYYNLCLLGVHVGAVPPRLNECYDHPGHKWNRNRGFVVAAPQV